ncbi:MAG TPA: 3-hydroxyacyl-ACP dehydratase FabZ [Burkholderiales bacterium]|nr:3-hydroxyacyl-ACP dehydratase FabZ [Burkholderiales bacterium]
MTIQKPKLPININEIMKQIPHKYPFLLIDRVIDIEEGKKIITKKNVTINEPFFMGHFPEWPVMPGVLIVEALAQTAGILSIHTHGARKGNELYFFAAINNARFKKQVIPGDTLIFEVELMNTKGGMAKYKGTASVDGVLAAEAELMIAKKEI